VGVVDVLIERLPRWEMMSQIYSLAALSSLGLRSSGPADVVRRFLRIPSTAAGVNMGVSGLGQVLYMKEVRSGCFWPFHFYKFFIFMNSFL